jgi:uncharacterized membrane protein
MTHPIANTLISLVIVLVLISQAWKSPRRSYRRASFSTAAVAFGVLTTFNARAILDKEAGPWIVAVLWLVSLLMLASLILLVLSWRSGEMRDKIERARQAFEKERKRRTDEICDDDTP